MSTKLLPCPFCGNAGTSDPRHTYSRPMFPATTKCAVQCGQCSAVGPFGRSEADALRQWNERTPLTEPPAPQSRAQADAVALLREARARIDALLAGSAQKL